MREVVEAGMVQADEQHLVLQFFGGRPGYFVEVGANHPQRGSQTWLLEQNGWDGALIEPLPETAEQLRRARRAKVFAVACMSPENSGRRLPLYVAGPGSSLDRTRMQPGTSVEAVIDVATMTLDNVLREARAPQPLDFLSIDVEGNEIEVLRGFDFARWRPRLLLLEDHVADLSKHRFVTSCGYRLVRRTGLNGWYVPADSAADFGWKERVSLLRKYWLALPFRLLRNFSRRLRQPFKDRRAGRQST